MKQRLSSANRCVNIMFQSVAREYFSSSNFLNRRILTDIATVEKSYDGKWNELQEKEKEKVDWGKKLLLIENLEKIKNAAGNQWSHHLLWGGKFEAAPGEKIIWKIRFLKNRNWCYGDSRSRIPLHQDLTQDYARGPARSLWWRRRWGVVWWIRFYFNFILAVFFPPIFLN